MARISLNQASLDYLHYAYEIDPSVAVLPTSFIESAEADQTVAPDPEEAHSAFVNAVLQCYNKTDPETTHIIPLSSGLDSRAILCGLVYDLNVPTENIVAVTFGYPGTYNFEYGKRVADHFGVKCQQLDTRDIIWNEERLTGTAKTLPHRTKLLNAHILRETYSMIEKSNSVIWSGFLGGESAGNHLPTNPRSNWEKARERFAESAQKSKVSLTPDDYIPTLSLPESPFVSHKAITFDEQLDYAVRQQCFIRPVVAPQDMAFITPYLQPQWLEFILNIPQNHRRDRSLFKQMCLDTWPSAFEIPTDANFGLPLQTPRWKRILIQRGVRPMRRYLRLSPNRSRTPNNGFDYEYELRHNPEFQSFIRKQLEDIKKHGELQWVDSDCLWKEHQSEEANRESEIRILACFELFEKIGI